MSVAAKVGLAKIIAVVNAANCRTLSADFTLEPFDLPAVAFHNPAFADLFRKTPYADPAIDDHSAVGTIAFSPASAKKPLNLFHRLQTPSSRGRRCLCNPGTTPPTPHLILV